MKKFVTRVLGITMAAALLTVLSGCGGGPDVTGTWQGDVDMADAINEGFAADETTAEYMSLDEFVVTLNIQFNDDGTYEMYMEDAHMQEAYDKFVVELEAGVVKMMEDMVAEMTAENGLDMTVDEVLEASGTSMDQLVEETVSEVNMEELFADFFTEGNYEVEEDKLFLSAGLDYAVDKEVYEVIEVEGDTMIWVESTDESVSDMYPITYTKIQ